MPPLNTALLQTLARLSRIRGDGTVVVELGSVKRTLHLSRGELISADSTLQSDRLGSLLVARGRIDEALVEPVSVEARRKGILLGEQLIHDGLLTPTELAQVLEDQVLLRFVGALTMNGDVAVGGKVPMAAVIRKPVGAALFGAFRESLPLEALLPLLAGKPDRFTQFPPESDLATLQMQPFEARVVRRLAGGETVSDLLKQAPSPERTQRVLASLFALELVR